jgi:hypothetical protein
MRVVFKPAVPSLSPRWWGVGILLSAILLQALAVRFALDRLPAAAAFTVLALTSAFILVAPGAFRKISASVAALRTRLRWWHVLWMMLLLSDLVFRIRATSEIEDTPVDFWAGYRIGLIACAGFVLLARFATGRREWVRSLSMGLVRTLVVYCAISAVSSAWSVYPSWTLYKSVEFFVDISVLAAIIAHVNSMEGFKSLFDWTWMLMSCLMATVWMGVILWPDLAFSHDRGMVGTQIVGVMPEISANGVGELSAVLAIVALSRILVRGGSRAGRGFYTLMFTCSLATMLMAQTRSALMAFVFAVAVLLFFSKRVGVTTFLIVIVALIVLQTSAADFMWKYFLRGQDQKQFETLSGRTGWWSTAWQRYLERPLTGYGAYAGGRFVALAEQSPSTSSLHNTYAEVLLGTGPFGLIPVIAALVGTWWLMLKALARSVGMTLEKQLILEALAVLALVTVRSVFTSHLIWHPSLSFLIVFGFAEFLRRKNAGLIRGASIIRVEVGGQSVDLR